MWIYKYEHRNDGAVFCVGVYKSSNSILDRKIVLEVGFCLDSFCTRSRHVVVIYDVYVLDLFQVELWEAILTFLFFPILVLIAYAADKQV